MILDIAIIIYMFLILAIFCFVVMDFFNITSKKDFTALKVQMLATFIVVVYIVVRLTVEQEIIKSSMWLTAWVLMAFICYKFSKSLIKEENSKKIK